MHALYGDMKDILSQVWHVFDAKRCIDLGKPELHEIYCAEVEWKS